MTKVLTIVDHASNHVPDGIDLGLARDVMTTHIAWDIGSAALADALGYPAHKASVSRLVIDLNREEDAPGLVPATSDGQVIPGNQGISIARRIDLYWTPYHDALAARIADERPALLLSLHSFTPYLASKPDERRPWEVGVLYNRDERAARIAIPLLEAAGIVTGDQLPYSGKLLNATSDGQVIPGNQGISVARRIDLYWKPYHDALAARIADERPALLLSLHSFTPYLASKPEERRPWEVGVLYNRDERAARMALPLLEAAGIVTGDQLPYSGKLLNATMNRHGEGTGTPYLGLEVRQDLIGDAQGVRRWAERLRPIIDAVAGAFA